MLWLLMVSLVWMYPMAGDSFQGGLLPSFSPAALSDTLRRVSPAVESLGQKTGTLLARVSLLKGNAPGSSGFSEERGMRTLRFTVKKSLHHSVCRALPGGDCKHLSAYIARILSWYMDVNRAVRKGDAVALVYEKLDSAERFRVLKLRYQSGFLQRTLDVNYFKGSSMQYGSYFDADGQEIAPRLLEASAPIREYIEITSLPGDFRKGRRGHAGTDFKTEVGTPVYSSFDGRVTRVNWNQGKNGLCIEIRHPRERVKTLYLHLNKVRVRRGQYVKTGERIGEAGNTGRSFAPHLHYEIRGLDPRKTVHNPFRFRFHKKYVRRIVKRRLPLFRRTVSEYDRALEPHPSSMQAGVLAAPSHS